MQQFLMSFLKTLVLPFKRNLLHSITNLYLVSRLAFSPMAVRCVRALTQSPRSGCVRQFLLCGKGLWPWPCGALCTNRPRSSSEDFCLLHNLPVFTCFQEARLGLEEMDVPVETWPGLDVTGSIRILGQSRLVPQLSYTCVHLLTSIIVAFF